MTMRKEKQQPTLHISKVVNTNLQLNLVINCLFLVVGLSLGVIGSSYLKSIFLNLQASSNRSSIFNLQVSSSPNSITLPSPSPSPSPSPLSMPPPPTLLPPSSPPPPSPPPPPFPSPPPPSPPPLSSPPPPPPPSPSPPPPSPPPPSPPPLSSPPPLPPPSPLSLLPPPPPSPLPPSSPPPTLSLEMPIVGGKSREENTSLMHNMDNDQELFAKVLFGRIDKVLPHQEKPKVAFMFLTKGPLPLAPLWEKFFKGYDGLYSIYVHPDPSFNESAVPENSVFYRRRIPSKKVEWGRISIIDAERRLLANALLDPSNQRFVLLSETCIPLFNFTTVYGYLINSKYSFLNSFDDKGNAGRGRYKRQMSPNISIYEWRKGSQWFEVHRDIAIEIISDQKYYPLFKNYCKPSCYSDEHYFPTLVNIVSPELNSNRTVTWVDWSRGGPHPRKVEQHEITIDFLNNVRFGSNCTYNGNTTAICVLFARKFMADTLKPLLEIAPSFLGLGS